MNKMILVEAKLFLREPGALIFAILLPLGLLLGLGMIPDFQEASPEMGGQRVIDNHLPAMMTILAVVTMALTVLPGTLAAYRESGVLRRMSTTPVSPFRLLVAQLVNNLAVAVVATALLVGLSHLVHGTPFPGSPLSFAGVFLLGTASLFGLGLLIAALAPTAKSAPGIGSILMFPLLFMAGMWIPRELMPDLVRRIGDFLPMAPFAQALRDTWAGHAPQTLHLVVMAATLLAFGALAARLFRWQ
ncbi:ABC transporter permease [Planomonospora venezuelensis]|uniref:Transport permease protein n=1 Tax=Planomonospora venezuelensis TaxID=1999 RepID=A0A841DDE6_PLAVE|nr:ABC transporter permease [Planomonospora venezuelensis]MBB5966803.1 ABC-2 type transport system permease protein [Planomonospora venezuelensis]GIN01693.1 transport permease protein [Planomonospora venezuelensis]